VILPVLAVLVAPILAIFAFAIEVVPTLVAVLLEIIARLLPVVRTLIPGVVPTVHALVPLFVPILRAFVPVRAFLRTGRAFAGSRAFAETRTLTGSGAITESTTDGTANCSTRGGATGDAEEISDVAFVWAITGPRTGTIPRAGPGTITGACSRTIGRKL